MAVEKATGWKVPLLFALCIIVVTGVIYLALPGEAPEPDLPGLLLQRAKATKVDLESGENSRWRDAIVDAASGFSSQDTKDVKLLALVRQALAEGNLDAACAAAGLIKGSDAGKLAREEIFAKAVTDCNTLQYGVFAVQGSEDAARVLRQRWEECGGK